MVHIEFDWKQVEMLVLIGRQSQRAQTDFILDLVFQRLIVHFQRYLIRSQMF